MSRVRFHELFGGLLMTVYLGPAPSSPPFATPVLTVALTDLRQDIFDQAGPSPRWQDT